MIKTVQLESHSIEVDSSMGWLFIYRRQFGHDILPDLLPLIDAFVSMGVEIYKEAKEGDSLLEHLTEEMVSEALFKLSTIETLTVIQILWAMAKNADNGTEEPERWVKKFDVFPFDSVILDIVEMIIESSVTSKNSRSLLETIKTIKLSISPHSQQQEFPED